MTSEVKQHWEDRYAERERIWSGRVNAHLAEIAAPLTPGRALDLGCGEGGDSLWLAEHGWQLLGVDISETALGRAAAEASARGLTEHVRFVQTNLSEAFPEGSFDLVSAQFLQSLVHLDRERIFAAAAGAIAPGGVLIIVDHGAAPPWAQHIHDHVFPTAEEVLGLPQPRGVAVGSTPRRIGGARRSRTGRAGRAPARQSHRAAQGGRLTPVRCRGAGASVGFVFESLFDVDEAASEAALRARVEELERLKSAAAAAQARATALWAAKRRAAEEAGGIPAAKRGKGLASEVALARRDAPVCGNQHLGSRRRWSTRCRTPWRRWSAGRSRSGG